MSLPASLPEQPGFAITYSKSLSMVCALALGACVFAADAAAQSRGRSGGRGPSSGPAVGRTAPGGPRSGPRRSYAPRYDGRRFVGPRYVPYARYYYPYRPGLRFGIDLFARHLLRDQFGVRLWFNRLGLLCSRRGMLPES